MVVRDACEIDGTARQEIQDIGASTSHGGLVSGARAVDKPRGATSIKRGRALYRKNEVDLSTRMDVVRTNNLPHLDDVHAKAIRGRAGLKNASISDSSCLPLANPTGRVTLTARFENRLAKRAIRRKSLIQISLKSRIQ